MPAPLRHNLGRFDARAPALDDHFWRCLLFANANAEIAPDETEHELGHVH